MYIKVTKEMFRDEFFRMRRGYTFTNDGFHALFDYLTGIEETESSMELDVIRLCCEFTQYNNLKDYNNVNAKQCDTIDEVSGQATIITVDDESFIVQDY